MKEKIHKLALLLKNNWGKLTLPAKIAFIIWTFLVLNGIVFNGGDLNPFQWIVTLLFGYLLFVGLTQLITRKKKKYPIPSVSVSRTLAPTDSLPVETAPNIILSDGEVCHYCGPAAHIKQKNVVVGYSGGSRGTSVRIAKGATVRLGSSKASPVRGDVQDRSDGILSITNKRVIFSGVKVSFDKKISSLSAVTPGQDGIVLQFGSTHYPIATTEAMYVYQLLSRLVNLPSGS